MFEQVQKCPVCTTLCSRVGNSRRIYCSDKCCNLAYLQRHPGRGNGFLRAWRKANPAKVQAQIERWPSHQKEEATKRSRLWSAANPDKRRASWHLRRARLHKARLERIDFQMIRERDKNLCGICGKKVTSRLESFDHIVPLSDGGNHSNANLRLAHVLCNIKRNSTGVAQVRML